MMGLELFNFLGWLSLPLNTADEMYCETFKDTRYSPPLNVGIRKCKYENIFPTNFAELAGLNNSM